MAYEELIRKIDSRLNEILPSEGVLSEEMRYAVFPGGKRIRPILTLLAAGVYSDDMNKAIDLAAAIEMIHSFSIIHDDLPSMDNETLRRGKPPLYMKYGEGLAVITGDALFNEAFGLLARSGNLPAPTSIRIIRELTDCLGVSGVAGGQMTELSLSEENPTIEELKEIYRGKTGGLISASVKTGAIAGGCPDSEINIFESYGENLGIAFQILDDLDEFIKGEVRSGEPNIAEIFSPELARDLFREKIALSVTCLEPLGNRAQALKEFSAFIENSLPDI
ncbi:MAG: polyprenyl synthetase family protein [Elusimicrobia bacterium]|nr:polyprenyl synthetase family protein [Elusimicrobiota bacterium]